MEAEYMRSCNVCTECPFRDLVAANDNEPEWDVITLPEEAMILRQASIQRLAIAIKSLGLPRREIPNWMADAIYQFEGEIRFPNGVRACQCKIDIDAAFNDDGSFRWLSDFLRFATRQPRQAAQKRTLDRLRLLLLALMINKPDLAFHVLR
jgi:hypothetical protein